MVDNRRGVDVTGDDDADDTNDPGSDYIEMVKAAIEDMRGCGAYSFADDFLRDVYDSIMRRLTVTERQKLALRNILNSRPSARDELGCERAFD